mmetsp:Transcript_88489/g.222764  ORF Transcript_88489/g.222764 Transcript_88489/m.222764 type:complete len:577 (+) Transcript_88489:92-1822(+)
MGQRCCSNVNASEVAYGVGSAPGAPQSCSYDGAGASCRGSLGTVNACSGKSSVKHPPPRSQTDATLSSAGGFDGFNDKEHMRRSVSGAHNILVEGDAHKTVDELLRELARSVALLETQYQSVVRHPDADAMVMQRTQVLTKRLSQQVRRMRLRAANSWQPDGEGDADEWMSLLLGGRKRFSNLQDVVKQVQLEGRIIRRWQARRGGLTGVEPRSSFGTFGVSKVNVDSWEAIDVFRLEREHQQPLVQVFMSVWTTRSFGNLSKATREQVLEFMRAVEASYRRNPYHNRMHAAEVTATAYYVWAQLAAQEHLAGYFSEVDLLAVVLAAAVHDMAHPGTANDFLVKTQHELAIRYCDRSVLEHFHVASAFALMQETGVPLLEHTLPSPPADTLKGRVVDMVLATDMAQHRRMVDDMASEVAANETAQDIDKLVLERYLLHLADIGHALRPRAQHREWSILVRQEFFAQGDQEKKLGLTPVPLCDRDKAPTLAKGQQGFLNFVVVPAWRPLFQVLGATASKSLEWYLADNQAMWAEELAAEESEEAQKGHGSCGGGAGLTGRVASPCRAKARKTTTTVF